MTYPEWYQLMNEAGWHQHTITKSMTDITIKWRHETATKADGSPITIDADCAELHWRAGTTPPPF
jgi:hypothetical protein